VKRTARLTASLSPEKFSLFVLVAAPSMVNGRTLPSLSLPPAGAGFHYVGLELSVTNRSDKTSAVVTVDL
jgi:hypothetical protein